MIYYLIMIIFIPILFFIYFKITSNLFIELFEMDKYKEILLNNPNKKIYNLMLNKDITIYEEDCEKKCSKEDCVKLYDFKNNLDKCLKCQSKEDKCFKKSIIGGLCDNCGEISKKIDCLDVKNFGCTNPYNLQSNIGVSPYYIEIPDNNLNTPFDKKCVFCWNNEILDNI